MSEKILSIAIAAYNMEEFLPRCLDSVLILSICPEIEVLIVNDGSKDSTLEIAMEYARKYPETVRVIDKQNGGYGSAINKAIDEAHGKYFKTLDADDWFDKEALVAFVTKLKTLDADLIITHFSNEYESINKSFLKRYNNVDFEKIYDFSDFCIIEKLDEPGFAMHAITYLTEILLMDGFRLSECYYSDVDYSVYPLVNVKSLVFVDLVLYKYLIGRAEQSVSPEGLVRNFKDHLFICKKLVDYYTDYQSKNDTVISLNIGYNAGHVTSNLISVIFGALYSTDKICALKQIREFMSFLRKRDSDILELAKERVYCYGRMRSMKS